MNTLKVKKNLAYAKSRGVVRHVEKLRQAAVQKFNDETLAVWICSAMTENKRSDKMNSNLPAVYIEFSPCSRGLIADCIFKSLVR